jgi:hypothetical protein
MVAGDASWVSLADHHMAPGLAAAGIEAGSAAAAWSSHAQGCASASHVLGTAAITQQRTITRQHSGVNMQYPHYDQQQPAIIDCHHDRVRCYFRSSQLRAGIVQLPRDDSRNAVWYRQCSIDGAVRQVF